MQKLNAAVFLDRDGTLIVDRGYLDNTQEIELLPGVGPALARIQATGLMLVVVTNQSGIGRGYFPRSMVREQHRVLSGKLREFGVTLDAVAVCPHHPQENCDCRKPRPGMLVRTAQTNGIDLASSYMIGDKSSDIEAGRAAGCRTVLLQSGQVSAAADFVVRDWPHAADAIINDCRQRRQEQTSATH